MDLSICVALSASWRAAFSRNECRRRLVPVFCDPASIRLTIADASNNMPTRVDSPTAVQHLTKALFLSKPVEPPLVVERSRDWMDQAEGDLRHAKSDLEGGYHD